MKGKQVKFNFGKPKNIYEVETDLGSYVKLKGFEGLVNKKMLTEEKPTKTNYSKNGIDLEVFKNNLNKKIKDMLGE